MLRSLKCPRRRKHIGKKTCSVTIVIFARTGRQDWTQSVITSENSYSSMIFQPGVQETVFDSQQLLRTFWLSRTLPSDFFSTKRVDSRTVNRRPLWQMKVAFKLKKRNKGMQGARSSQHFSSSSQPHSEVNTQQRTGQTNKL